MINKIEKSVFFPIVRVVSFSFALLLFIGMIYGIFVLFQLNSKHHLKTYVSFEDIQKSLAHSHITPIAQSKDSKLKYSESVQKYMLGENESTLEEWLNFYTSDLEKQNFLDNLTMVIQEAEMKHANVVVYINQYKNLKQERDLQDSFGVSKYVNTSSNYIIFLMIGFGFLLFIFVVILLLLLSIERNTRKVN